MKKCVMIWVVLVLLLETKADTGFLKNLSQDDISAAGLQKLTPEELVNLDKLVLRYRTNTAVDSNQQAKIETVGSARIAEKKSAEAETKVPEAQEKADAALHKAKDSPSKDGAAPAEKQPSWFTALVASSRADEKKDNTKAESLKSRLVGDFDGWNGRSDFKLENGTRWVQQNQTDTYLYAPTLHSPKVRITPASIQGFWLEIEGLSRRVRVIPLDLSGGK